MSHRTPLDRLALGPHLGQPSAARTTGAAVGRLPLEERLFLALTSLPVVCGRLLALDRPTRDRLRHAVPRHGAARP